LEPGEVLLAFSRVLLVLEELLLVLCETFESAFQIGKLVALFCHLDGFFLNIFTNVQDTLINLIQDRLVLLDFCLRSRRSPLASLRANRLLLVLLFWVINLDVLEAFVLFAFRLEGLL